MRYICEVDVPFARLVDDATRPSAANALIVRIVTATQTRHALVTVQFDRQRNVLFVVVGVSLMVRRCGGCACRMGNANRY